MPSEKPKRDWKALTQEVIFKADTPAGKTFDILLLLAILISVVAVMLDSMAEVRLRFGHQLFVIEWFFTIVFTAEYLLRIWCLKRPSSYTLSFYGVVDLIAVLPTYLSLVVPGSQYLMVVRLLRVLRVFRVLKVVQFVGEARLIVQALKASRRRISVFLFGVLTLVVILGSVMYLIEGEDSGFTSIPRGIYWAIVTLTTVGYGDISPTTGFGQALAACIMIIGYGLIAVPTGIVTVEMVHASSRKLTTQDCPSCGAEGHDADARHCKYCGHPLQWHVSTPR
jgi:voltage-gated potassium channel